MASLWIIVVHPLTHNRPQVDQRLCFQEQRVSVALEMVVEGFHLGVVFGAAQGIRELQAVLQKQLGRPLVACGDRVLIVVHNACPNTRRTAIGRCPWLVPRLAMPTSYQRSRQRRTRRLPCSYDR